MCCKDEQLLYKLSDKPQMGRIAMAVDFVISHLEKNCIAI